MACRHPREKRIQVPDVAGIGGGYSCTECGRFVDRERSLRGKRANKAGRRQSWEIAKDIGGKNHEVEGEKYDVTNEMYAVQSKRGSMFPERIWKWLQDIPRVDGRIPVLIIRDAPGPGTKRRGVAIMGYEDFIDTTGVKG